jgi:flagellar biosynthesis GTPase FlhF
VEGRSDEDLENLLNRIKASEVCLNQVVFRVGRGGLEVLGEFLKNQSQKSLWMDRKVLDFEDAINYLDEIGASMRLQGDTFALRGTQKQLGGDTSLYFEEGKSSQEHTWFMLMKASVRDQSLEVRMLVGLKDNEHKDTPLDLNESFELPDRGKVLWKLLPWTQPSETPAEESLDSGKGFRKWESSLLDYSRAFAKGMQQYFEFYQPLPVSQQLPEEDEDDSDEYQDVYDTHTDSVIRVNRREEQEEKKEVYVEEEKEMIRMEKREESIKEVMREEKKEEVKEEEKEEGRFFMKEEEKKESNRQSVIVQDKIRK